MADDLVTVFISYARESAVHNEWVKQLADTLEKLPDFTVVFDQYDLHAGKDLTHFMERGLQCQRVVAVITPEYVRKAGVRSGGVGYESSVISADVLADQLSARVVPVLRSGNDRPPFLRSKLFVDFRTDARYDVSFAELRHALLGSPMARRPLKHTTDDSALWVGLDTYAFTEQPEVPEYRFDTFIASESSQVALSACMAAVAAPGRAFSPLFLFGPPATGKTHLLHAMAHELRQQELQVLRLATEGFVTRLITAIRYDRMNVFRRFMRAANALLLDDVQFLAGKERTQEELFHCLNDLSERHAQIVLTCDTPPQTMKTLERRIRARFEGGLIVEIGEPSIEVYAEIARRLARREGVDLPEEIVMFIASQVNSGVRQLQSLVTRVIAEVRFVPRKLDIKRTREIVRTLLPSEGNRQRPGKG